MYYDRKRLDLGTDCPGSNPVTLSKSLQPPELQFFSPVKWVDNIYLAGLWGIMSEELV